MKKLFTLLMMLLISIGSTWATTYTITYGTATGTFYRNGEASTNWSSKWVSNEEGKPVVTITTSVNNINGGNARMAPQTYKIFTEPGYKVTGFAMNCPTFGATVTVTPSGESAVEVAQGGTLVVNSSASSFVFAGGSGSARIQAGSNDGGSFTITVEEDPWAPSFDEGTYLTVGEKVSSFTAATAADDNDHWYILTQAREGETPMYDNGLGNQLKRAATSVTLNSLNGALSSANDKYLIRFKEVGEGTYNIQFANGNWIDGSLNAANVNTVGTYAFYNCNGGSGSYFAWNLNGKSGSKVDNNGAGNTVSFWGSGETSGSSGNNVWYMYETTLEVPNTTYVYEISDASGVVYTSGAYAGIPGESITEMPSDIQREYCSYDVTSTTLDVGENTVLVTVTYNLPFTLSTSFESAKWYYATLRGKQLRADESHKDDSGRYQTNSTNERTDVYKWAFVGNPYNLSIINKGHEGKCLYAGDNPVMQEATPASDNKARWVVSANDNGGFSVRSESGVNLYINDAGNGGNLGYWNSSWAADDTGSNWVVTEVPAKEITVTYELYVGGVNVDTKAVISDINSSVEIPAQFTNAYTTFAYNYSTSGTIGEEDCTITVTATLKDGVISLSDLSNSKKYKLTTSTRGSLSTYTDGESGTFLASPVKTSLGISAKEFAIINYENKYYLYSVSDEKFVTYQEAQIAPLANMITGTSDAISFSQTTNSVYEIRFDGSASKILNSSASYTYGIVLNGWGDVSSEWDDGCQYIIEEVDDFDATDALAVLEDFFHGPTAFANAIAELKAINWGLTTEGNKGKPNYYNFSGDYAGYAGNEMGIIEDLESAGFSAVNLAIVQDILANGYALNIPATGKYYRIKGYSNNYITSNAAGSNASMNGEASADNIVFYSADKNLIFYGSGYGLYNTCTIAPAGSTLNAYTFIEGSQKGHYYIKSNYDGSQYCFDNTANGAKVDKNGSPVTSGNYETDWTLEEVASLPLHIDADSYTSFAAPVPVKIPNDCKAYIASGKGGDGKITMERVEGDVAEETGLIISTDGVAKDLTFDIATTGDSYTTTNKLVANLVAANVSTENYFFGKVSGDYVFAKLSGDTYELRGYKAYLDGSDLQGARISIVWGDENPTGISELNDVTSELKDGKFYQNGRVIVVRNGVKYNTAGQTIK